MIMIRAKSAPWYSGIELLVTDLSVNKIGIARPIVFDVSDGNDGKLIEPTTTLQKDEAQILMDDLWNCGLRPTEGTGSAGALSATQKHLEDMRTLVFQLLKG